MPAHTIFSLINSGGTITEPIGIGNSAVIGVWPPLLDNTNVFIRGSFDTTSANFKRVLDFSSVGSPAVLQFGAGSYCAIIANVPFPYIKLETSAAQTAPRSFALSVKF